MGRTANLIFGNNRIKNGKSAYELAVQNGYIGTLTEWLESLIGAPGTNGTNGINGTDGIDGDDGREIELQENAGWIEWRYVGDATWTQLFEIPTGGGGSTLFPATITSETTNSETETTHTHELGNVNLDKVISGVPVEYGALYNFWAANDIRNISGDDNFRIPTDAEIDALITYLGGYEVAGGKLKETGIIHWETPNIGATNEFGVSLVGAGIRSNSGGTGIFGGLKQSLQIWCSTSLSVWGFTAGFTRYDNTNFQLDVADKFCGYSVRLIADATGVDDGTIIQYVGNNGFIYNAIAINGIYILTKNLNETKYRNGDWITGFDGGVYTPISNAAWAALTTEAMCYYSDNEAYGGGETPLETLIANTKHNSLKEIQGGSETERYHLTDAEHTAVQNLGSISTYDFWIGTQAEYDAIDPKDANTIYHVEEE